MDNQITVDDLFELMQKAGARSYGGERVSQLAHALQAAKIAVDAGEPAEVVIASLFHDIGHLVGEGDRGLAAQGIDAEHESIGAVVLSKLFGEGVAAPVRLHVAAKRYLCFAEASYWDGLSEGSKTSLRVQGGPFDAEQARAFLDLPHADAAVRLRRYDDAAKEQGRATPPLEALRDWIPRLESPA